MNKLRERHFGEQDSCERQSGLVTGIVLVAVGAAFMADRLGYWSAKDIWQYWPVILIALGLGKILATSGRRRRSGVWLLMIGGIFLMDTLEVFELQDAWPLFIVAAGIMTVWRAIAPPAPRPPGGGAPPPVAIGDQPGTRS
jgi:hypothetical protein